MSTLALVVTATRHAVRRWGQRSCVLGSVWLQKACGIECVVAGLFGIGWRDVLWCVGVICRLTIYEEAGVIGCGRVDGAAGFKRYAVISTRRNGNEGEQRQTKASPFCGCEHGCTIRASRIRCRNVKFRYMLKHTQNHLGQPIGPSIGAWTPPRQPSHDVMKGLHCVLEPLSAKRHAAALYAANALDGEGRNWTYLPYGPFPEAEAYEAWVDSWAVSTDPLFFAVCNHQGEALGVAAYLRIAPDVGCIEVGHLNFSPRLQRTPAATEAMYLMMAHAFALGYRRYEWKCDALNAPSRSAALRLGFCFEGVFRQATIYKGRSRDTAWFSIIDAEWPALKEAFGRWLASANFDANSRQLVRLSALTSAVEFKDF